MTAPCESIGFGANSSNPRLANCPWSSPHGSPIYVSDTTRVSPSRGFSDSWSSEHPNGLEASCCGQESPSSNSEDSKASTSRLTFLKTDGSARAWWSHNVEANFTWMSPKGPFVANSMQQPSWMSNSSPEEVVQVSWISPTAIPFVQKSHTGKSFALAATRLQKTRGSGGVSGVSKSTLPKSEAVSVNEKVPSRSGLPL